MFVVTTLVAIGALLVAATARQPRAIPVRVRQRRRALRGS